MADTTISATNLKFDILVEQGGEKGFTARALAWPDCVVEAATREEALRLIRVELLMRLAKADLVTVEFTPEEVNNPWLKYAGMWKDDPDFDEFLAEIERYRREVDARWAPWMLEPEEDTEQPEAEAVLS
jgi:hypothetical protein